MPDSGQTDKNQHMTPLKYTAEIVAHDGVPSDIRLNVEGKTWHLWGRMGEEREIALAKSIPDSVLPVLIGSGLGTALRILTERGLPVAVVDKERPIIDLSAPLASISDSADILWLDESTPKAVMDKIHQWQANHDHRPLASAVMPLYLRLDRDYYGAIAQTIKTSESTNFWSQARYPKFRSVKPRVLFFDANYFLCGEIKSALERLDIEYCSIELEKTEIGNQDFIKVLLKTIITFRPDFILTVNHFGFDRQGKLAALLNDLGLPLASWFVDNPHLILHNYDHPGTENTSIFTYDAGNLDLMRSKGFENVHYLPLATDPERFKPGVMPTPPAQWQADVSFVGNSMTDPVAKNLQLAQLPQEFESQVEQIASQFGQSGLASVAAFLQHHAPDWHTLLVSLPTPERKLALESLITWEATRQYRLDCVKGILDFSPLIVGDEGWHSLLPKSGWSHISGLDYYDDLPRFYPSSTISFNCTSRQMIGAVNQRVFDVPACGGFVLTDHREQMEDLFDINTEVAVYHDVETIPHLVQKYLKDDHKRKKIAEAARQRILAEHTYEIRIAEMLRIMAATFS